MEIRRVGGNGELLLRSVLGESGIRWAVRSAASCMSIAPVGNALMLFIAVGAGRASGLFRAVTVDDQVVGSISVERGEDVYSIDGELGYMLLTDHWSQGIMTQAVAQITHLAFELLDIQRITAHAFAPNIASARVLEKNGYEKEATIRKGAIKNGEIHTIVQYGWVK